MSIVSKTLSKLIAAAEKKHLMALTLVDTTVTVEICESLPKFHLDGSKRLFS